MSCGNDCDGLEGIKYVDQNEALEEVELRLIPDRITCGIWLRDTESILRSAGEDRRKIADFIP